MKNLLIMIAMLSFVSSMHAWANDPCAKVLLGELLPKVEFRPIPAGSFMMGEEGTRVLVSITAPFEIMSKPITPEMWVEWMGENPIRGGKDNGSVVNVSYNDIQVLIQKLNAVDPNYVYRFPTEAEWDYAKPKLEDGIKEWVADWWSADHPTRSFVDPMGSVNDPYRVIRGGLSSNNIRPNRHYAFPDFRSAIVGARLVRTPKF